LIPTVALPAERSLEIPLLPSPSTRRPVQIASIVVKNARRKRGYPATLSGINAYASKGITRA
jgi:hypothetical protein